MFHQMEIPVIHPHAVLIAFARWSKEDLLVHANPDSLELLHLVAQNVLLIQNAIDHKLVLVKNVATHALEPVERTQNVKLSIIVPSVVVLLNTLVIHLSSVSKVR
jgi:hypothetical protein